MKHLLISLLILSVFTACDSDPSDNISSENVGIWINELETDALDRVEFLGARGYDTRQACSFFKSGSSYQIQSIQVLSSGIIFPVLADEYGIVELSDSEDILGRIEFDGAYTDNSFEQRSDGPILVDAQAEFPEEGVLIIAKLFVGTFGDENELTEVYIQSSFEELEDRSDMLSVFCRD